MILFILLGVSVVLILIAGFFGMAGRTYFALLVSPSLYSLFMWPPCRAVPEHYWGSCILDVIGRPYMVMLGPFVMEEGPLLNPYPGMLLIALMIVAAWTAIEFAVKRYEKSASLRDPGK